MKKLETMFYIVAGNVLLAFAVCAFVVPNGFMLGGSVLGTGTDLGDHGVCKCVPVFAGVCFSGKAVCHDVPVFYDYLSHYSGAV